MTPLTMKGTPALSAMERNCATDFGPARRLQPLEERQAGGVHVHGDVAGERAALAGKHYAVGHDVFSPRFNRADAGPADLFDGLAGVHEQLPVRTPSPVKAAEPWAAAAASERRL